MAPKGVPPAIIAKLNAELNIGLKARDMEARLEPTGVGAAGGTPEQFGTLIRKEIVRYAQVIRDADIRAE